MRYLVMYTPSNNARPHSPEFQQGMEKLVADGLKSGELVSTGGLLPIQMGGARVKCDGGQITVIDGPFTESKEVIIGWAIIEAADKQGAIESTRRFLKVAGDGISDIRQIMTESSPGPGC